MNNYHGPTHLSMKGCFILMHLNSVHFWQLVVNRIRWKSHYFYQQTVFCRRNLFISAAKTVMFLFIKTNLGTWITQAKCNFRFDASSCEMSAVMNLSQLRCFKCFFIIFTAHDIVTQVWRLNELQKWEIRHKFIQKQRICMWIKTNCM